MRSDGTGCRESEITLQILHSQASLCPCKIDGTIVCFTEKATFFATIAVCSKTNVRTLVLSFLLCVFVLPHTNSPICHVCALLCFGLSSHFIVPLTTYTSKFYAKLASTALPTHFNEGGRSYLLHLIGTEGQGHKVFASHVYGTGYVNFVKSHAWILRSF